MCFSAQASFVAAAVAGVASIAAMARVHERSELPLAAIPLFFAVQQTTEGFLWLTLPVAPVGPVTTLLTQAFLLCALVFWPVFAPLAVLCIERDVRRRQWIGSCLLSGVVVGCYFLWSLLVSPQTASYRRRPYRIQWRPQSSYDRPGPLSRGHLPRSCAVLASRYSSIRYHCFCRFNRSLPVILAGLPFSVVLFHSGGERRHSLPI